MAGTIDPKQFIGDVNKLQKEIDDLVASLVKINSQLINIDKSANKYQSTQKQTIDNTKALNDSVKTLSKTEEGIIKIEKQIEDGLTKLKVQRSEQNKDLLRLQERQRQQKTDLKEEIKLEGTARDSLVRKRSELKKLTQQYDQGSAAIRKNLNPQINKLTKEIGKAEQATGRHQRNVGNYKDAINGMPGPLGNATRGVQMFGKQLLALLANPIVLIIAAIVAAIYALGKAFSSTDAGATEFAARFEQIKAIVDVVRQRLIDLIGAFGILFDKSKTWKERFKELGGTFEGTGDQIRAATKAAYEYKYALDALSDAEDNYISQASENRRKIAELEFTAQDRSRSTTERRKALIEAISIGEEELKKQQDFAKKRYDEEVKYLAAKYEISQESIMALVAADDEQAKQLMENDENLASFRNKINDARAKELEEMYTKSIDLETRFFEQQKRNISRLSGFEEELANDRKARMAVFTKLGEQASKDIDAAIKKEMDDFDKFMDEQLKAEEELLNAKLDAQFTAFEDLKAKHDEELKMLEEKFETASRYAKQLHGISMQINEAQRIDSENTFVEKNDRLESEANKELQLAGDNADAIKDINDKLTQDKAANQKRLDDEIKEINRRQANTDKLAAIFEATINTAVAVTKLGVITPQAITAGILGLAQVAAIAATPIPKFAEGVKDFKGGMAIFGEEGRELVKMPDGRSFIANTPTLSFLPKGADVIPNDKTEQLLSGSDRMDELINAVKSDSKTVYTGYHLETERKGERKKYMDKYFRM